MGHGVEGGEGVRGISADPNDEDAKGTALAGPG
jgi:hypothetical protein